MLKIGAIYDVLISRRLQKKFHPKVKKSCMCFVDLEKTFDTAPISLRVTKEDGKKSGLFLTDQ